MPVERIWAEDRNLGGIKFQSGTRKGRASATWFRGDNCNYAPSLSGLAGSGGTEEFILQGWMPSTPFIDRQTRITAFGSCFAANISKYLARRSFNILTKEGDESAGSYVVRFGEGMVNSFAILQQFEWAFEGKVPQGELWHGYDAQAFGYDEDVRLKTREIFDRSDVFIITLGLSEIWYDEPTGEVFWRAVPQDRFDPSRHKFRVASVLENLSNLRRIVELIRTHRPEAAIVLTLSPIPLVATFRPVSCVTANAVSKANLRAAVDELMREKKGDERLFYWPSYEIVTEAFRDR